MSQQNRRKLEPTPALIPFGKHVVELRKKKGLSQEDLAGLCQLDRTYISGIENGKRNISLTNVFKLANALGIKPKVLLDYSEAGETL
ncbi:helix-turn-helix transcriptional regulator [Saccharophagus degradans]|uniref:Helix-turn-helix transcriptional regulator n=1 Tax=Saccharophagus degradans TaxID=86304 RepID=A0AAW7X7V1_9GAMM|nr:helix-turn-helix transcriptional regulator [Saccharophagus degradans]MBU2987071.1 helix-turn-helix transcriptional regulator [Saccharophagus degradans]MDO6423771.1 helix-turn-helix transcriptional regulator [Saccharophagus degradans]MDO6607851.1 helix-turn-helix transcriptional regulator [Saccharophagus degradans]